MSNCRLLQGIRRLVTNIQMFGRSDTGKNKMTAMGKHISNSYTSKELTTQTRGKELYNTHRYLRDISVAN
jgi:hypothetical protein